MHEEHHWPPFWTCASRERLLQHAGRAYGAVMRRNKLIEGYEHVPKDTIKVNRQPITLLR